MTSWMPWTRASAVPMSSSPQGACPWARRWELIFKLWSFFYFMNNRIYRAHKSRAKHGLLKSSLTHAFTISPCLNAHPYINNLSGYKNFISSAHRVIIGQQINNSIAYLKLLSVGFRRFFHAPPHTQNPSPPRRLPVHTHANKPAQVNSMDYTYKLELQM